jgi:hypothetical protein
MPVSIRTKTYEGFGNGSSRVRVYDHTQYSDSIEVLAESIREQVIWNKTNGTWFVPSSTKIAKILNIWPLRWLFKKYFSRDSIDYGTTIFSHMELLEGDEELYHIMENIEVVNMLHDKIPVSIFAVGFGKKTNLTFTYDSNLFSKEKIDDLKEIFLKNTQDINNEL